MSGYKLYKVYFRRAEDPENKYDSHVALFVRNGSDQAQHEGEMFHVIEDYELATDTIVHLKYDERQTKLETYPSFHKAVHIGSVAQKELKSLRKICANTPGVIAPRNTLKPDCVTWLDNVIYDLNKKGVVSFESSVKIPSQKIPTQVVGSSSSSRGQGSSSSSEAKGSSGKPKRSSSSGKTKDSPSSSKHKES